jgi:hypothetical protein
MLKNKDGGLAKAIPLLLCGGWVQGVCLPLVSEKQCRNKEEATGSRCGKFGVSCRGKDLMSRGPGAGKPTPPKYDVLSQTRRRRRPGGGRAVRRGAGAPGRGGICLCQEVAGASQRTKIATRM